MNRENISEFLRTLHCNQQSGVLSFEALGQHKREMYRANGRGADDLFNWIEEQEAEKRGVYFRQARLNKESMTCRKSDVVELTHLWVDIDGADTDVCDSIVQKFQPTYIIHSGGGLHVYWRLTAPINDAVQFQKSETVMKGLSAALHGDPAPTHIASLLRLPYTINFKYDPPVMSRIVYVNPTAEHTVYQLEDMMHANKDPYEKAVDFLGGNVKQGSTSADWDKVIKNLKVEGSGNEFGGRNNCVVKLAGYWSRSDINPRTQIRTLLEYGCSLPLWEMESIVNRIWEREHAEPV